MVGDVGGGGGYSQYLLPLVYFQSLLFRDRVIELFCTFEQKWCLLLRRIYETNITE